MGLLDKIVEKSQPLINWIGDLHWPYTHKRITGKHYYSWRDMIKPGQIFLSKTRGELSNIINPSELKHSAIYLGGGGIKYIMESVADGVIKTDLVTFLTSKDRIVIIEPTFADDAMMKNVAMQALLYKDTAYDFQFKEGDQKLYCFELIFEAYRKLFPDQRFKKAEVFGRMVWTSDSLLEDSANWRIVLDSSKGML